MLFDLLKAVYLAFAAILTRCSFALIPSDFAIETGEAKRASAGITALAGISARAAIVAWPVMGAVIEIYEESRQDEIKFSNCC